MKVATPRCSAVPRSRHVGPKLFRAVVVLADLVAHDAIIDRTSECVVNLVFTRSSEPMDEDVRLAGGFTPQLDTTGSGTL